ncbi:MAG: glycine cleavage T C-terminal barrel domain-containing protein [Gemmataceae bacterium]
MTYEAARSGCGLFDRADQGQLEVAGSEAAVFLHNLSTHEIKGLAPWHGCELFFCNVTARTLAYGTLWRWPKEGKRDRFWLEVGAAQVAPLQHHLDRHLISEDVELTDLTTAWAQLYLAGPHSRDVLTALDLNVSELRPMTFQALEGGGCLRHQEILGLPGYDLLVPAATLTDWRERFLAAGAKAGTAEEFDVLRVEAGTPRYGIDLDETTFAPEVNRIEQTISYHKGCYLGQEPIVMARDRGIVQRKLVGLRLTELVPPKSKLFRDGKEVGWTTSCVRSPRLGPIGLAYLRRNVAEPGTAVEVEALGHRRMVEVAALPFE